MTGVSFSCDGGAWLTGTDLNLSQILPMLDEDTGAEPRVVSASIEDPYLLLIRDDSSIMVAAMGERDLEMEELEREDDMLLARKWLSGCLYKDTKGALSLDDKKGETTYMFLLAASGALVVSHEPMCENDD